MIKPQLLMIVLLASAWQRLALAAQLEPPDLVGTRNQTLDLAPEQAMASCMMFGKVMPHGKTLPEEIQPRSSDQCERECVCNNGKIICQPICPPLGDAPPDGLNCTVEEVVKSSEDCCPKWLCVEDFALQDFQVQPWNATLVQMSIELPKFALGRTGWVDLNYTGLPESEYLGDQPPPNAVWTQKTNIQTPGGIFLHRITRYSLNNLRPGYRYWFKLVVHFYPSEPPYDEPLESELQQVVMPQLPLKPFTTTITTTTAAASRSSVPSTNPAAPISSSSATTIPPTTNSRIVTTTTTTLAATTTTSAAPVTLTITRAPQNLQTIQANHMHPVASQAVPTTLKPSSSSQAPTTNTRPAATLLPIIGSSSIGASSPSSSSPSIIISTQPSQSATPTIAQTSSPSSSTTTTTTTTTTPAPTTSSSTSSVSTSYNDSIGAGINSVSTSSDSLAPILSSSGPSNSGSTGGAIVNHVPRQPPVNEITKPDINSNVVEPCSREPDNQIDARLPLPWTDHLQTQMNGPIQRYALHLLFGFVVMTILFVTVLFMYLKKSSHIIAPITSQSAYDNPKFTKLVSYYANQPHVLLVDENNQNYNNDAILAKQKNLEVDQSSPLHNLHHHQINDIHHRHGRQHLI